MTEPIEIRLSDGRIATVRRAKHRDTREAYRVAGNPDDKIELASALLAQVVTIDGHPIIKEDLDDLYADDVAALMEASGSFLSRSAPNSSSSNGVTH
jgi:hypothetical protein